MAESTRAVPGLDGEVLVHRDRLGIPHARAASTHDAFFAQGFVQAEDRLGQLEYDRRRAQGRWAEVVGRSGLGFDVFARRADLAGAARREYQHLDPASRAVLDAYAAGVNAWLGLGEPLPTDLALAGVTPERWEPWDCCAVFLVRHVAFAGWQKKLWRGRLAARLGAPTVARLEQRHAADIPLIVPPGVPGPTPAADPASLAEVEAAMAALADGAGGSNSWALAGTRTRSGLPLVAGDPHRLLEVPNVYYQCHLAGPEFDAVGLAFVGVPGFPHFGHTARVAWCVTNANGDYQDLYVEHLDDAGQPRHEQVAVRDGDPVSVECRASRHGPILFGDPDRGVGLALRTTALARPSVGLSVLLPMLPRPHRRRARHRAASLGRPGEQPGVRRRRRARPLPDGGGGPHPRRRQPVGSRPRPHRRPRLDRAGPARPAPHRPRPRRRLPRHRQPGDRRPRLPALPRRRLQPARPGPTHPRPRRSTPRRDRRRHGRHPPGPPHARRRPLGRAPHPPRSHRRARTRRARPAGTLGPGDGRRLGRRRGVPRDPRPRREGPRPAPHPRPAAPPPPRRAHRPVRPPRAAALAAAPRAARRRRPDPPPRRLDLGPGPRGRAHRRGGAAPPARSATTPTSGGGARCIAARRSTPSPDDPSGRPGSTRPRWSSAASGTPCSPAPTRPGTASPSPPPRWPATRSTSPTGTARRGSCPSARPASRPAPTSPTSRPPGRPAGCSRCPTTGTGSATMPKSTTRLEPAGARPG